jgi:N-acyl homoserine lactone hydrolase
MSGIVPFIISRRMAMSPCSKLRPDDEYAQEPDETLSQQLKRLGYRCEDVRTVILTHLHEDHVGGLCELPKAKVVVSQAEWDARRARMFGFMPMFYQPSYASVERWERVCLRLGAFPYFQSEPGSFRRRIGEIAR